MRQVQARAVRQECAEGVEEVGRGGRKEGWEQSLPGSKKGQAGVAPSFSSLSLWWVGLPVARSREE